MEAYEKFHTLCRTKSRSLSLDNFRVGCKLCGISNPADISDFFKLFDVNASGLIDFPEFAAVMFRGGRKVQNWDIMRAAEADRNRAAFAGKVSTITTASALRRALRTKAAERSNVQDAFVHFTKRASSGRPIDLSGFKHAIQNTGIKATRQAQEQLFNELDPNMDGVLSYTEFVDGILGNDTNMVGSEGMMKLRGDWIQKHKQEKTLSRKLMQQQVKRQLENEASNPLETLRRKLYDQTDGAHRVQKAFTRFRQLSGVKGSFVTQAGFGRACEAVGLGLNAQQLRNAFLQIDTDDSGAIEFKEFCTKLFKTDADFDYGSIKDHQMSAQLAKAKAKAEAGARRAVVRNSQQLLKLLRTRATASEANGQLAFKHFAKNAQMSSEGNGITLTGFRKAVLASDITAAPGCVEALFRELDPNGDGAIQFSEFMRGVLGEDKSLAGRKHIDDMRHDNLLDNKMQKTKMRSQAQERTSELLQAKQIDPVERLKKYLSTSVDGPGRLLKIFKKFRQTSGARGNTITFKSFATALGRAGVKLRESEARAAFDAIDTDHSGAIEYNEFLTNVFGKHGADLGMDGYKRQLAALKLKELKSYANKMNLVRSGKQLKVLLHKKAMMEGSVSKAFTHFSKIAQSKGRNSINLPQFKFAIEQSTLHATNEAMEELFSILDPNKDGVIDYNEFVKGIVGDDTNLAGQRFGELRKDWMLLRQMENVQLQQRRQQAAMVKLEMEDPLDILRVKLQSRLKGHNLLDAFKRMRSLSGASSNDITPADFGALLDKCGLHMPAEQVRYHFRRMDPNNDGVIDYREFCRLLFGKNKLKIYNADDYFAKKTKARVEAESRKFENEVVEKPAPQLVDPADVRLMLKKELARNPDLIKQFVRWSKQHGGDGTSVNKEGLRAAVREVEALKKDQLRKSVKSNSNAVYNPLCEASDNAIDMLFDSLDPNGDKRVDHREFVAGLLQRGLKRNEVVRRGEEWSRIQTLKRVTQRQLEFESAHAKATVKNPLHQLREKLLRSVSGPGVLLRAFKAFKDKGDSEATDKGMTYLQFKTAMYRCGLFLPRKQAKKVFAKLDKDDSGYIDFQEFVASVFPKSKEKMVLTTKDQNYHRAMQRSKATALVLEQTLQKLKTPAELRAALNVKFRQDNSMMKSFVRFSNLGQTQVLSSLYDGSAGTRRGVSREGFLAAIKSLNIICDEATCNQLYAQLDPNNDGVIDYNEFVKGIVGDDTNLAGQSMEKVRVDHIRKAKKAKAVERAAIADKAVRHYRHEVMTQINGGVLETLKKKLSQMVQGPGKLLKAFNHFKSKASTKGGLVITLEDFHRALEQCNVHLALADSKKAFKQLDLDGSGSISYVEFVERMFGTDKIAIGIDDYGNNFGKRVRAVNAVTRTKGIITSEKQLRTAIEDKIKGLSSSPSRVFNRFRMIGRGSANAAHQQSLGEDDNGMRLENFALALVNLGIRAEHGVVKSLFRSLVGGASSLTYEAFVRGLIDDANMVGSTGMMTQTEDWQMVQAKRMVNVLTQQQDVALSKYGKQLQDPIGALRSKIKEHNIAATTLVSRFVTNDSSGQGRVDRAGLHQTLYEAGLGFSREQTDVIFAHGGKGSEQKELDYRSFVKRLFATGDAGALPIGPDWVRQRAQKKSKKVEKFVHHTSKNMDARALLESIQTRATKATNVLAAFKDFTRQSNSYNGRVTLEQFRTVCNQNGIRTDDQTVAELFNKLDLDGDGAIDYKEFVYGVLEGKVPVASAHPRSPISDVRAKARREVRSDELTSSMIQKHFEANLPASRPSTGASYQRRGGQKQFDLAFKMHLQRQRKLLKSQKTRRSNRSRLKQI